MNDFDLAIQNAWAHMFSELDSLKQESLHNLTIETQPRPSNLQTALTQTPPGHTLLGLYHQNKIILFEEPIRQAAASYNQSVEEIFELVVSLAGSSSVVVGMGNIGGQGLDLVTYFKNRAVVRED